MSSSSALANAALIFGVGSWVTVAIGVSEARGGDLMALGVFALGLLAGAAIGVVGLSFGVIALRRGGPGRGRAIAGLVLSSLPVLLFAALIISARLERAVEQPLERPPAPPTRSIAAPVG
ncbi:MAG: hypothetical protein H6713_40355 [Myxococcales bacterium]|nr:hypothetical protein [Myxococcales bacterium]